MSKAGWLELAEARKSTGSRSVSSLQLPSTEGEREVEAVRRVVRAECKQDNGVRCGEGNILTVFSIAVWRTIGVKLINFHFCTQGTITSMSKRAMRKMARRIAFKRE